MSSDEMYISSVFDSTVDERAVEVSIIFLGLLPRSTLVCYGVLSIQSSLLNLETFPSISFSMYECGIGHLRVELLVVPSLLLIVL